MKLLTSILYVLCSPLLIFTWGLLLMMWSNSYLFGAAGWREFVPTFGLVFFSTFIIPGLAVLLMYRLKMIPSLRLENRQDRIGPIFAVAVLYSAFYFNVKRMPATPEPFSDFMLGGLITLFLTLFLNAFYRLSLHAAGMAVLTLGMFLFHLSGRAGQLLLSIGNQSISIHFLLVPVSVLLVMGALGSIRIRSGREYLQETLMGWLVGMLGGVLGGVFS